MEIIDDYMMRVWTGFAPSTVLIGAEDADSVETWVHEAIEISLWYALSGMGVSVNPWMCIHVKLQERVADMSIVHAMSSLLTYSVVLDKIVQPDEFWVWVLGAIQDAKDWTEQRNEQ